MTNEWQQTLLGEADLLKRAAATVPGMLAHPAITWEKKSLAGPAPQSLRPTLVVAKRVIGDRSFLVIRAASEEPEALNALLQNFRHDEALPVACRLPCQCKQRNSPSAGPSPYSKTGRSGAGFRIAMAMARRIKNAFMRCLPNCQHWHEGTQNAARENGHSGLPGAPDRPASLFVVRRGADSQDCSSQPLPT